MYEPDEDEQGIGGRKKMMKRKEKCVGGSLLDLGLIVFLTPVI